MIEPRRQRRVLRPSLDRLDDRCLLSALTPAQITHAYGLDAVTFSSGGQTIKGDGSGETIAIVDAFHDPYLASDLHTFDQQFGLNDPALAQVDLAGGRIDSGWAQEEALDVEWAHAIAPGASIVVVEAKSPNTKDLLAAVDTARSLPSVVAVSMSWGGPELSNQRAMDTHFTTPAGHTGITFVAASGDEGPSGGAEWPASSPRVLAVGGTSLLVDASGNYLGEAAWAGTSGGFSRLESEPAYQLSIQASGRRSTPDVAILADPATGVAVFATDPASGIGAWIQVGGTSVGTPVWAAIVAIADQGRAIAGLSSLDGATQTLPTLYSIPASDFHKTGTLTTTGLGTPAGASLVTDLDSKAITVPLGSSGTIHAQGKRVRAKRAVATPETSSQHSTPIPHHTLDLALQSLVHEALRVRPAKAVKP
jgi:subtilase family serine protease